MRMFSSASTVTIGTLRSISRVVLTEASGSSSTLYVRVAPSLVTSFFFAVTTTSWSRPSSSSMESRPRTATGSEAETEKSRSRVLSPAYSTRSR